MVTGKLRTILSNIFTNSVTTNLRFSFTKFCFYRFLRSIIWLRSNYGKNVNKFVALIRKQRKIREKNSYIRRIRENKWRVCYRPEYFGSQEFLAWLFNESPSKDYVVTNDRWGQGTGKKHGSVYSGPDRWQPGSLIEHKWESAMTIDQKSWGIRRNIKIEDVLTPQELISQVSIL